MNETEKTKKFTRPGNVKKIFISVIQHRVYGVVDGFSSPAEKLQTRLRLSVFLRYILIVVRTYRVITGKRET